ncbi:DUF1700 domain-containing protein [Paenibacillus sp. GP183]|uniref:HAAS signaling domain-containing protein n=1 Tax=Paenibacillus sp. GP183 TaxID=1882751 RepID=UPI00089B3230|nr:DUF1700 domain-containing protein [Paenibacillus sp. GP183]SEC35137.1 Uncharacterized membrane protein [Paenibacillus sp. GP183]
MSKVDYFRELTYRLRGLPERERQNILSVYEELFQKAAQNGKHEEEIAQSLGYPRIPQWDGSREQQPMANLYANTNPYQGYQQPFPEHYTVKQETGFKAIIASIALGFFNLVFVLGPFISICGFIFALYVASAACLISPVALIIGESLAGSWTDTQFVFFTALAVFGLGILLTVFTLWFSRLFFKLAGLYIRFNMKIIKGA